MWCIQQNMHGSAKFLRGETLDEFMVGLAALARLEEEARDGPVCREEKGSVVLASRTISEVSRSALQPCD